MNLPEHEKLQAIHGDKIACELFMEWLNDQGIWLGRYDARVDRLQPVYEKVEALLYTYFEIDPNKLEAERVAILDAQRALNDLVSSQGAGEKR